MNEVKIFENAEFGEIRTIEVNGDILFCAVDVAAALGYKDSTKAIKQHCREDGVVIHPVIDSMGRTQMAKFISEGNLYRLTADSELPSAERFNIWIFDEVLPSLRKTGNYIVHPSALTDHPGEVANLIKVLSKLMERQGSAPYKVTENAKIICEQYGIQLPDDFVRVPEYEQIELEIRK